MFANSPDGHLIESGQEEKDNCNGKKTRWKGVSTRLGLEPWPLKRFLHGELHSHT